MSIEPPEAAARAKIRSLYGTPDDEFGPTLFVSHHLEELDDDYWVREFGSPSPDAPAILDALVLVNAGSSEENGIIDVYDFSLPKNVTDYVLSVHFEDGEVCEVVMES